MPTSFQFPLSERTNCNPPFERARVNPICLSVSSIGTNELQLQAGKARDTVDALSVSSIGTNELQLMRTQKKPSSLRHFQFPLSERTNCNTKRQTRVLCPRETFSFLYRNERTATQISYIATATVAPFQFPLSERTNCNSVKQ